MFFLDFTIFLVKLNHFDSFDWKMVEKNCFEMFDNYGNFQKIEY
jgi:hypothetical protein